MFARVLAAALAIGVVACGAVPNPAQADDSQDRLKRLLDEKFGSSQRERSTTRGLPAPSTSRSIDNQDIYVIKPDGSVADPNAAPQAAPGKRSMMTPAPPAGRSAERFAAATSTAGADGVARSRMSDAIRLAQDQPPAARQEAMPAPDPSRRERFIARRNTFVVQLKPDATGDQIDNLIKKYNLEVLRSVSSLGVLYVQVKRPPPTAEQREKWRATRSVTPKPQKDTLTSVFEPKIIVDMRKDPAVDAAFVDSTIRPRTLPRSSDTKVQTPQQTYVWSWTDSGGHDGNWGLKAMHMPVVWTILDRFRKANPDRGRTRVAFLDSGFGKNRQITFKDVWGGLPASPPQVDCGRSHGTHVAGIVGAISGKGTGIDGVVPDARLEAIPITRELLTDSVSDGTDQAQQHVSFFMDALADLAEFLDQYGVKPDERRVVNISLAYNWAGVTLASKANPTADKIIRDQIRQHAKVVQTVVNRFQDRILFVAAAGNDSDGLAVPVTSELASPFAYAGTHVATGFRSSANILVVEARDRDGRRASFSNVGGHVAAPGVDVMSTFASDKTPFGVCSGTSQAAPHVAGLAAILFELDPNKTPAEISDIIRSSAVPASDKDGAPMIDALAAVLKLTDTARYLADLDGDGKVDIADLRLFKDQMIKIESAKFGAQAIDEDLNGDGVVDGAERCWPRIDLNGSGRASYDPADARIILGQPRSDLDMIRLGWTDTTKTFDDALKEVGVDQLIAVWQSTALVAAVPEDRGETEPCR